MAYSVELSAEVDRELDKLDAQHSKRILKFLHARVAKLDDPRSIGEALHGSRLGEFWKYRALPEIALLIRLLKKTLAPRGMVDCETREALSSSLIRRGEGARPCRQPKQPQRPALAEYLHPLTLGIRA